MKGMVNVLRRIFRDNRGFTLVELMAVLAVLSIIFSIAVPRFTGTIEAAKEKADEASLAIMNRALEQYIIDHGEEPDELDDLVTEGYLKEIPEPQTGGEFDLEDGEVVLKEE